MSKVKIYLKKEESKDEQYFFNGEPIKSVDKVIELEVDPDKDRILEIDSDNIFFIEDEDHVITSAEDKNTVRNSAVSISGIRGFFRASGGFDLNHRYVRELTCTNNASQISMSNLRIVYYDKNIEINAWGGDPYSSSHWRQGTLLGPEVTYASGLNNRPLFISWNKTSVASDNTDHQPGDPGYPSEPFWDQGRVKITPNGENWMNLQSWNTMAGNRDIGDMYIQYKYNGNTFVMRINVWYANSGRSRHRARVRCKLVVGGKS